MFKTGLQTRRLIAKRNEMMVRAYMQGYLVSAEIYKQMQFKPVSDALWLYRVVEDTVYFDPIKMSQISDERVERILYHVMQYMSMWSSERQFLQS